MRLPLTIDLPVPLATAVCCWPWPERGLAPSAPLPSNTLPVLCVRSAWLALLESLCLPTGSAVLLSGWTIPDMAGLLRSLDLVPVPIDLDADAACPTVATCEAAWQACRLSERPVNIVLIAQLFGARHDLTAIAEWAHGRGLLCIEDAAQAFAADNCWLAPGVDASLWSFGTIKTATAGGGGLLVMRDRRWLRRVARVQAAWPQQSRFDWWRRFCRTAALALISRRRAAGGLPMTLWPRLAAAIRGFAVGIDADRFRRRPHPALLALMARRLRCLSPSTLAKRARTGRRQADRLGRRWTVPGSTARRHQQWVVPLTTATVEELVAVGRRHGWLLTPAGSLAPVAEPAGIDAACPVVEGLATQTRILPHR